LVDPGEQLRHGLLCVGQPEHGGDLREGHEHERALGEALVRNAQPRGIHYLVPISEDVHVDRAGGIAERGLATQAALDALEEPEEVPRREVGLALHGGVQEAGLVQIAGRLRLVQGGDGAYAHLRAQVLERFGDVGLPVAQIGAHAYIDSVAGVHTNLPGNSALTAAATCDICSSI